MTLPLPIKVMACAAILATPSTAFACDLDGLGGYGGMHRYDPFGGMRGMSAPNPSPAPKPAPKNASSNAKPAQAPSQSEAPVEEYVEEPRKWEVQGGSPVTAEDKATFT